MTPNEIKDAAKIFLDDVLGQVKRKDLLLQKDGQRKLVHMWIAAAVVKGVIRSDLETWALKWDNARALDAVEAFRPQHPVALEWRSLKASGLKPANRGRGRSPVHGRNLIAVHLVAYLVDNEQMDATRNHHPASRRNNDDTNSACDIVAEVLNKLCSEPVEYHAIRNAWEKRDLNR